VRFLQCHVVLTFHILMGHYYKRLPFTHTRPIGYPKTCLSPYHLFRDSSGTPCRWRWINWLIYGDQRWDATLIGNLSGSQRASGRRCSGHVPYRLSKNIRLHRQWFGVASREPGNLDSGYIKLQCMAHTGGLLVVNYLGPSGYTAPTSVIHAFLHINPSFCPTSQNIYQPVTMAISSA